MININKNIKLFILFALVFLNTRICYGYAEAETSVYTDVQPSVFIQKQTSSVDTGSINPLTGVHTGLNTVFDIQTNGNDDSYDFIIQAKMYVDDGFVSAYGNNGCILFANTLTSPTTAAIEDAKTGGSNNKNVIAYPVTVSTTNPMTAEFQKNYSVYGDCYVVKVNNGTEGTVTHIVGQTPISGTYNIGQDPAGTYQAVVTFTAVSK